MRCEKREVVGGGGGGTVQDYVIDIIKLLL